MWLVAFYDLKENILSKKPPIEIQSTTLWDYPSQSFGNRQYGDNLYPGVTPAHIIWNILQRYTKPGELVVDPMAGSGTTLDVARDLDRRGMGYDLQPTRNDIFNADARKLPLPDQKADCVFIDPPYSTHIKYSGRKECLGELHANSDSYYRAMKEVISEIHRILKNDRHMAIYISDSFEKDKVFMPIGFEIYQLLRQFFKPVDIVAVKRYNKNLINEEWHQAAVDGNFFMRGFNYLFIMKKEK